MTAPWLAVPPQSARSQSVALIVKRRARGRRPPAAELSGHSLRARGARPPAAAAGVEERKIANVTRT